MKRHLLSAADLTLEDATLVLDTAEELEKVSERTIKKLPTLRGRTVVNLFFEDSTRTKTSFELAAKRLSADVINFSAKGSSVSKGETLKDTALTLEAMGSDAVVCRHSWSGAPANLSRWIRGSVVNAGDGTHEHPTQALLDALTILEAFGREPVPGAMQGLRVAICGDLRHGRVGRSNLRLLRALGADLVIAGPGELAPATLAAEFAVELAPNLDAALDGAHVAMMLRIQRERLPASLQLPDDASYHAAWGLSERRLERLAPDGVVLHPGPMNRGVEIADAVADGPRARILRQVTLGVAVRMAVLARACGVALNDTDPNHGAQR